MKYTMITIAAIFSLTAFAESLDSLLSKQTTQVVSPVKIGEQSVSGNMSYDKFNASMICAGLGFPRVVEVMVEPCMVGEPMVNMLHAPEGGAVVLSKSIPTEFSCKERDKRIAAITCAR